MRYSVLTALACGLLANSLHGAETVELKTKEQRISYSIGADIGATLKQQGLDIDAPALAAGVQDAFSGKTLLSEEEMKEVMTAFQQEMMSKMQADQATAAADNLKNLVAIESLTYQ